MRTHIFRVTGEQQIDAPVQRRHGLIAIVSVCAVFAPLAGWAAQGGGAGPMQTADVREGSRSAVVTRITTDIAVDGSLDEEIWRTAPTIGPLTQREPATGEAPSEQTDVTLLYDDDNLYIGVM